MFRASKRLFKNKLWLFVAASVLWSTHTFAQVTVAYVTDIEGSKARLLSFFQKSSVFELQNDGAYHLKPNTQFVFGGDAFDRYFGDLWVVRQLLRLKRETPDRVTLILGNRDINKLRLAVETSDQALMRPTIWHPLLKDATWQNTLSITRTDRIRFMLQQTMGAPNAFELRRQELATIRGLPPILLSNEVVAKNFIEEASPGGTVYQLIQVGELAHRIGNTLWVHGGVTRQNLGHVPGEPTIENIDTWIEKLNHWKNDQVAQWTAHYKEWDGITARPGEALLEYPMPSVGKNRKQTSVVTGRTNDTYNNPRLPEDVVIEKLEKQGLHRVLQGHTPTGDMPIMLRTASASFQMISADNSYTSLEENAGIVELVGPTFDALVTAKVSGQVTLDTKETLETKSALTLGEQSPLGMMDSTNAMAIGRIKAAPGKLVTFKMIEKFQRVTELQEEAAFAEKELLQASTEAFPKLEGRIGFYSDVFDPPTLADKDFILKSLEDMHINKLFLIVQAHTGQEYHASVTERMDMLKLIFKDYKSVIEIRAEPCCGEKNFLQILIENTNGQVIELKSENVAYSERARTALFENDPKASEYFETAVFEWLSHHNFYQKLTDAQIQERKSAYHHVFEQFAQEVKARLTRLPIRSFEEPAFFAYQSKGAWLEKFIANTVQQNQLNEVDTLAFVDALRYFFSQEEWQVHFPVAKLRSGPPSARCLALLNGDLESH